MVAPSRSTVCVASGASPVPVDAMVAPSRRTQAPGTSPRSSTAVAPRRSTVTGSAYRGSGEDDRAGAVEQDPVLGEPLHGLGEGARLLVLPDRDQLGRGAGVVDADDVLLDDR